MATNTELFSEVFQIIIRHNFTSTDVSIKIKFFFVSDLFEWWKRSQLWGEDRQIKINQSINQSLDPWTNQSSNQSRHEVNALQWHDDRIAMILFFFFFYLFYYKILINVLIQLYYLKSMNMPRKMFLGKTVLVNSLPQIVQDIWRDFYFGKRLCICLRGGPRVHCWTNLFISVLMFIIFCCFLGRCADSSVGLQDVVELWQRRRRRRWGTANSISISINFSFFILPKKPLWMKNG